MLWQLGTEYEPDSNSGMHSSLFFFPILFVMFLNFIGKSTFLTNVNGFLNVFHLPSQHYDAWRWWYWCNLFLYLLILGTWKHLLQWALNKVPGNMILTFPGIQWTDKIQSIFDKLNRFTSCIVCRFFGFLNQFTSCNILLSVF